MLQQSRPAGEPLAGMRAIFPLIVAVLPIGSFFIKSRDRYTGHTIFFGNPNGKIFIAFFADAVVFEALENSYRDLVTHQILFASACRQKISFLLHKCSK